MSYMSHKSIMQINLKATEATEDKEGRNMDDTLESMFAILDTFPDYKFKQASFTNSNWLQYKHRCMFKIPCKRY